MRKACSLALRRVQSVRAYSTALFSPSLVRLQRGGQGQGGGSRYGNGSPPPRQQQQQQQYSSPRSGGGGGSNRPQGFGDHQQGYNNNNRERGGYMDSRRQGQGQGDRQHGYENRPRGGFGGNRGRDGGNRQRGGFGNARAQRRTAADYLARDAETLLQMKQAFKHSKTEKERMQIMREARRLLRRACVDASTQDERSVMILLNCGATFKSRAYDGIEGASRWVQANARGLSPHNIALYANALGAMELERREEVFRMTVMPLLPSRMRDMTPVEVVMVLQAFQRLLIAEGDEVKDELLLQLEPCIPTMPVPQLSTLAEVLTRHTLRQRNEEKWQRLVQEVMNRALESVDTMHSKEAITFLCAASRLKLTQEQLCSLFARATATAGFHNDEQVADLIRVIAVLPKFVPEPTPELEAAVAALRKALIVRLEKVAPFVSLASASTIWRFAAVAHIELPTAVVQVMCDGVLNVMTFKKTRVAQLARLASAVALFRLPSTELLDTIAKVAIGERLPRPQHAAASAADHDLSQDGDDIDAEGEESLASLRAATQEALYGRFFRYYLSIRHSLENAYANLEEATLPATLTSELPQHLLQHIPDAPPKQLLWAMEDTLALQPGCPLRNVANDEALFQGVLDDVKRTPEKYKSLRGSDFFARLQQETMGNAKGKELVNAVQHAMEQ